MRKRWRWRYRDTQGSWDNDNYLLATRVDTLTEIIGWLWEGSQTHSPIYTHIMMIYAGHRGTGIIYWSECSCVDLVCKISEPYWESYKVVGTLFKASLSFNPHSTWPSLINQTKRFKESEQLNYYIRIGIDIGTSSRNGEPSLNINIIIISTTTTVHKTRGVGERKE